MGEMKTGVAERLREVDGQPGCSPMTIARTAGLDEPRCHDRGCNACLGLTLSALADAIDAELAAAREASAREGMELVAAAEGWPAMRDGESVVEWVRRCWLPRPRYDDGEPVEVGGRASGLAGRIRDYLVSERGDWTLFGLDDYDVVLGSRGTPVRRPPEDTQEDIDAEATLPPTAYCAQRGIDLGDDPDREKATTAMIADLLRRQRQLDKRKGGAE